MDGRPVPFVLHKSYGGGNNGSLLQQQYGTLGGARTGGVSSVMGGHIDRALLSLPTLYPPPYIPSLGHQFHTLESVEAACRLPLQVLAQQQLHNLPLPFQQALPSPSIVPQNALGLLPLPDSLQPKNESAEKPATIIHATAAQDGEPGRGKKRRRLSKHNRLALQNETHDEIVELDKRKKTYKCLVCDVILNSLAIMQYHLFSNRHRNQMRKKKNKKIYRAEKKAM